MTAFPIDKVKCHYQDTPNPGTAAVVATFSETPMPVGYIWWRVILRKQIEIVHMYTYEHYRRKGIATKLLHYIREAYADFTICTAQGNELSTQWLIKNKFENTEEGWFLRPTKTTPAL